MERDEASDARELLPFLESIYSKYGVDLRGYRPQPILRRIDKARLASGLSSVRELEEQILDSPERFTHFLESLSVHVTEMFRDPGFYRALRERVVPILRTFPLLRIWHAGCATGEEAYSMAILLAEEGLLDRSQIYATDLSQAAIARAKQGIYPALSVRKFTENYQKAGGTDSLSHYYRAAYDRIAIVESVKKNIFFFQHDLISDYVFGEMQVVLCRNVLIYFGPDLRERVLAKFLDGIARGGFLCLGTAERLSDSQRGTSLGDFATRERIYRRIG